MMIKSLFTAADIDEKYRREGKSRLEALLALMSRGDTLYHQVLFGEKPTQTGVLEDYAFVVDALLAAYESDYDPRYLSRPVLSRRGRSDSFIVKESGISTAAHSIRRQGAPTGSTAQHWGSCWMGC
jgi:uncharacterized protein YyaL (SSP411 family)